MSVGWGNVWEIRIPRGEVGDGYAPKALTGGIEDRQFSELAVGDSEGSEGVRIVGHVIAINIQINRRAYDVDDLNGAPIFRRDPSGERAVVVSAGDRATAWRSKKFSTY